MSVDDINPCNGQAPAYNSNLYIRRTYCQEEFLLGDEPGPKSRLLRPRRALRVLLPPLVGRSSSDSSPQTSEMSTSDLR